MHKQINVIAEDFTLRAECSSEIDIATVSISTHEVDEEASDDSVTVMNEKDTAEVYLDPIQLREVITALTHILEMIEREGE